MTSTEIIRKLIVAIRGSGLGDVLYLKPDEDIDGDIYFDSEERLYVYFMKTPFYVDDVDLIKYRGPESGNPWIRIVFNDGTQMIFDKKYRLSLDIREGNTRRTYRSSGGVEGRLKELCRIKESGIENDEFVVVDGILLYYNGSQKKVIIPEGVVEIGQSVFFQNTDIEEVSFPGSLKLVSISAFEGCTHLKKVNFNKGLQEILESAFQYCESLKKISLPPTIKYVYNHSFESSGVRIVEGIPKKAWVADDAFFATDYHVNMKNKNSKKIKDDDEE